MKIKPLDKAKCQLIVHHPFFGILAAHLQEREMSTEIEKLVAVPTAATDGKYLYVNPDWVKKLSLEEQVGLAAHEVLHVGLGHVFDFRRGPRDRKKWNIAADFVVNLLVRESGLKLPEGGLYDEAFKNMSVEEVYSKIPDQGEGDGSGKGNGKGGKKYKLSMEDLLSTAQTKGKQKGKGEGEGEEDGEGAGVGPEISQQQLAQEWKELLVRAAYTAKMRGKLPAGIERLVDAVANPKIPWYEMLESFVNDVMRDDYDMCRQDRRYLSMDPQIYLPDLYNEVCSVAVAVDTSGSIGPKELGMFVTEAVGILKSRRVTKIRLMACDAKVTLDKEIGPNDNLPRKYPGGGGTDFRPVFARLKEKPPAALIFLTDLYGSFPRQAPPYPVMWVTYSNDVDVPFGTKIKFDPNDDDGGMEIESADADASSQDDNDGKDVDDFEDAEVENPEEDE